MKYQIKLDKYFDKSIEKEKGFHQYLKKLEQEIIPQLKENPYNGNHIKKLKGRLDGLYRYRIGKYRMFYCVNENDRDIILLEVVARKDAY